MKAALNCVFLLKFPHFMPSRIEFALGKNLIYCRTSSWNILLFRWRKLRTCERNEPAQDQSN